MSVSTLLNQIIKKDDQAAQTVAEILGEKMSALISQRHEEISRTMFKEGTMLDKAKDEKEDEDTEKDIEASAYEDGKAEYNKAKAKGMKDAAAGKDSDSDEDDKESDEDEKDPDHDGDDDSTPEGDTDNDAGESDDEDSDDKPKKKLPTVGSPEETMKEDVNDLSEAVSRKDFQLVADTLKAIPDMQKRQELANHHAEIFAKQNPRFNHALFHKAAGTKHE